APGEVTGVGGDGRAGAGHDHVAGDENVGRLQCTAVGDGERAAIDLDEATDGKRPPADGEPARPATAAHSEGAADVTAARQRERAAALLHEAAAGAAVLDRSAQRGRKIVAADGELVRSYRIRAGALDRAGGDPAVAQRAGRAGEVYGAAGIGNETGVAAIAVAGELRQRAAVGGNGRVVGGAGVGK